MEGSNAIVNEIDQNGPPISSVQSEFPPGMAPKMLKLLEVLNNLESKMEPLISKPHHDVLSKLSPLERAKVGLMEVYTINSLFWVLMRTSGEDVDTTLRDDYKIEMARLKETQGKIAEIEARARRRGVDVRAASRFIHQGLGISRRMETQEDEMEEQYSYNDHNTQRRQNWETHENLEAESGQDWQDQSQDADQIRPVQGKKRRMKGSEDSSFVSQEECEQIEEDNQSETLQTQKKKQKKKNKKQTNVSANDIANFLDTNRGRIEYEIKDDNDTSDKGKNWYEQGWS